MAISVKLMDPGFDPFNLQDQVDQEFDYEDDLLDQIDSSELEEGLSQNNDVDLTELTQLLADHQDTTALIQEDAAQYFADFKQALEDLHSDLLMILLILLLTFARACLSSARSYLEKSGKAVH